MNPFRISDMTKPYMEYDMIQIHTDLPNFPEFRARLLLAFLHKEDQLNENNELYTLATSLVQMGLDTHDMVPVSNQQKEKKEARARQLKVLAGDYFSSRFYNILSQSGQIEMIKQLSFAICEVNRMKMSLYLQIKQLKITADDYILQAANIKMQLFLSFQKLMEGKLLLSWPEILRGFTHCEVIIEEIERSESMQNFHGGWAFWHIFKLANKEEKKQLQMADADKLKPLLLKYNILFQLYLMLEIEINHMLTQIRQLDSDKLKQELVQICEPFTNYLAKLQAVKE
jgi:heptaprenyl diphosphate synthase